MFGRLLGLDPNQDDPFLVKSVDLCQSIELMSVTNGLISNEKAL